MRITAADLMNACHHRDVMGQKEFFQHGCSPRVADTLQHGRAPTGK
jgi:hypothetical protein